MNREFSILILTHLFPNSVNPKLGTFLRNKAIALGRVGCQITVVAPVPAVPAPLRLLSRHRLRHVPERVVSMEGIEVYYPKFIRPPGSWFRPYEGLSIYRASRRLIRRLNRRERFDAVIGGMLTNDGYAATLVGRDLKIPAFSYAIGSDIHTYPKNEAKVARLTRRLFAELDGIFAVGPNFARQIQSEYPEHREKISCNAFGVDTKIFQPGRSSELWREMGFSEKVTLVLFVGDLSRQKGVEDIMNMLPQMRDDKIGFIFVGKGELLTHLQQKIEENSPGFDACRLFPYLNFTELVRFYRNVDFFLFPSHSEGSPTVLIEAIACGLPVVASDIPANHDAVTEGENGRFFPVGDVPAMEATIRNFLEKDDRKAYGATSREVALGNFDQEENARQIGRLLFG